MGIITLVMNLICYSGMSRKYLAQALTVVAVENGLVHVKDDIYEKGDDKYRLNELGYHLCTVNENYRLQYFKLFSEYEELELKYAALKSQYADLFKLSKEIDGKCETKIGRILNSNVSAEEKVKQLKKYLNA